MGQSSGPDGSSARSSASGALPEETWQQRHRWVLGVLWSTCAVALVWQVAVGVDAHTPWWLPASAALAILLAGTTAALPRPGAHPRAARTLRSSAAAFAVMATACYLVALADGAPESHFLFFILVPVVALYEARPPLLVGLGVVLVEHGVVGTVDPVSVYGAAHQGGAQAWTFALLHSALVALAALGSLVAWGSARSARARAATVVAQLQHQTRHDELTGLANRTGLAESLLAVLRGPAARAAGGSVPVVVVVMDLNRFKEVNDTLGHTAGDQLLRDVAAVMGGAVDGVGTLARLGGDEFALLLPGADVQGGLTIAELLREQVRERSAVGGIALDLDLSAGVAVHTGGELLDDAAAARVVDDLLRHADIAMYAAKGAGGGAAAYDPALDHHSTARLEVARDLRRAVERDDELLLHYQPKVALASTPEGEAPRLVGVEALVRWQHPVRGFMPPGDFIPVLEATDLVHVFTARMIDMALDQARAWLDAGYEVPIAVNAFPRCLTHPDFVPHVERALHARSLPPRLLRLEITEDALVSDPVVAAAVITTLKELGVPTSIDDFGTGYSSLSYLRRLPVDEVKLDRSFVTGLGAHDGDVEARGAAPADAVLVSSIIDLAHRLGMHVVAEGIEVAHETEVLRGLGCDVGQGYLFARPAPAAQLPQPLLDTARTAGAARTARAAGAAGAAATGLPRQRVLGTAGSSTGETTGPADAGLGSSSG